MADQTDPNAAPLDNTGGQYNFLPGGSSGPSNQSAGATQQPATQQPAQPAQTTQSSGSTTADTSSTTSGATGAAGAASANVPGGGMGPPPPPNPNAKDQPPAAPLTPEEQAAKDRAAQAAAFNAGAYKYTSTGKPPPPENGQLPETGHQNKNGSIDSTNYPSFLPEMPANQPTATKWNVTADQTVQGQMASVLKNISSSPLFDSMQDSLVRAQAAAGGGNSLMAQSAAYDKVVGLSFQIASTDAATFAKSAEFNASMANQFGLANQRFMQEALLSDQNYKQAGVLQTQQIAGQTNIAEIQAHAQLGAAGIAASASMHNTAASIAGQLQAIKDTHQNDLQTMDINHQYSIDTLNTQFQMSEASSSHAFAQQWALTAMNNAHQNTLQYGQNVSSMMQGQISAFGQIGSTAGLSAEQQAAAYSAVQSQTSNAMGVIRGAYMGQGAAPYVPGPNGSNAWNPSSGGGGSGGSSGGNNPYNGPMGSYMNYGNGPGGGFDYNAPTLNYRSPTFINPHDDSTYESSLSGQGYQSYESTQQGPNAPSTDNSRLNNPNMVSPRGVHP